MSTYGSGTYGSGYYGGVEPELITLVPVQIWVYARTGTFKAMYQAGSSPMVSLQFSHTERGCGSFQFEFASGIDVIKGDRIKIKIFGSDRWYYTGVARSVPISGDTKRQFVYSGFGYNDYFERVNSGALTYSSKTIAYILDNIRSTILAVKTPIGHNAAKVQPPAITVTTYASNNKTLKAVLEDMQKLANSTGDEYIYGVDRDGDLFFKPRSLMVFETLVVGVTSRVGIPGYEPEDSSEELTSLLVFRNNGTLLTTLNSDYDNDINEDKYNGPDVSDADLALIAAGILADRERTNRSASIEWPLTFPEDQVLEADGTIRVISTIPPLEQITISNHAWGDDTTWGGGTWNGEDAPAYSIIDDTLSVRQVEYNISAQQATRKIELGSVPLRLENAIVEVNRRREELQISLGR